MQRSTRRVHLRFAPARRGLLLLALAVGLAFAAAPALACQEDVQHAATDLAKLKARAPQVKPEHRARFAELIKEAMANLKIARRDCAGAKGVLERAVATAKVAGVRASMASAAALVSE